jgi:hypothetical protein
MTLRINGPVLIACERSGIVRDAFRAEGVDAVSCDLEPSDRPGPHLQGDVLARLADGWALMLAFPPCTHLASSGAQWFPAKRADGRQAEAVAFARALLHAPIERIALENPVGVLSDVFGPPQQIVQPYLFGDPFTKTTCLWLKALPPLTPTQRVGKGARHVTKSGRSLPAWYNLPPGPERARLRSNTFPGLAQAMARQWAAPLVLF